MTATNVWDADRRALTIGLVVTVTLIAFEGLAVTTIMPAVREDLGGIALYGWTFSSFFLASMVGTVLAGTAADRRGVGPPFGIGVLLFAAGLLLAALAPSMLLLVVARAVQGLGAGAVSATAVTTVARGYPEALRPRVFALMSTAWVVPGLIGPAISGLLADTVGWRWVFAGLLPVLAVSASLAFPRLRQLGPPAPGDGDEVAAAVDSGTRARTALLLAFSVGLLLAGLGDDHVFLAVALVLAGGAGAIATLSRLLPPGALRARRGLPAAVILKGILTFGFFGTDAFIALAVTDVKHHSIKIAGLALTAATLTWTAGAWINAHRSASTTPRQQVARGMLLISAGIALMIVGLAPSAPLATFVVAWGIAGLGMGIAYQSVTLAVLAEAPVGQEGVASGAQNLADLLGVATGTGVVGAVVAIGDALDWSVAASLRVGFATTLAATIAGVVLTRRIGASEPVGSAEPAAT